MAAMPSRRNKVAFSKADSALRESAVALPATAATLFAGEVAGCLSAVAFSGHAATFCGSAAVADPEKVTADPHPADAASEQVTSALQEADAALAEAVSSKHGACAFRKSITPCNREAAHRSQTAESFVHPAAAASGPVHSRPWDGETAGLGHRANGDAAVALRRNRIWGIRQGMAVVLPADTPPAAVCYTVWKNSFTFLSVRSRRPRGVSGVLRDSACHPSARLRLVHGGEEGVEVPLRALRVRMLHS